MADPSSATGIEIRPDDIDPHAGVEIEPSRAERDAELAEDQDDKASPSKAAGEDKETLLQAVLKAVGKDLKETEEPDVLTGKSPSPEREQSEKEGKPSEGPDLSKDPDEKELAAYKKGTRERIEQLIGQRNAYRSDAEVTGTLRNFLIRNDIAKEDFQLTLDLASAMRRGDFNAFLTGVAPYVQLATHALGITLPADLQTAVQQGRMSQDMASQASRDRYARALAEQEAIRSSQQLNTHQQQGEQVYLQSSVQQTVDQWEAQVKAQDPDYARKEPLVRNLLWSVVQETGAPQTPEQAVWIANEAYRRASDTARSFSPTPRATQRTPNASQRGAVGVRSEPKSMMDAALLGLERARRA